MILVGIEDVLDELARQNHEQRGMLNAMAESMCHRCLLILVLTCPLLGWRVESARQHEETIEAVRATAQEQVPFNVQGVSL
jgi:hypothetical protein